MRTLRPGLVLLSLLASMGCGGPTVIRSDAALPLPSGPPVGSCEQDGFLELGPATVFAASESSAGWVTTTEEVRVQGLAIFNDGRPVLLPDVLPDLGEPTLAQRHLMRLEPISAKLRKRRRWGRVALGTVLALLGGSVALVAMGEIRDNDQLLIAGASALGGTLLLEVAALIPLIAFRPTRQERIYHQIRSRLLLRQEDDFEAAARGVNRYNEAVRRSCR